jgi:hypothetical protein
LHAFSFSAADAALQEHMIKCRSEFTAPFVLRALDADWVRFGAALKRTDAVELMARAF